MVFIALLTSSFFFAVSVDCPNVIELARGLGMQTARPAIWTALHGDCCTASSVDCVGQRVIEIQWESIGLNGIINGTAIPSSVTYLDLEGNSLSGSIPNALPSGLRKLDLSGNQMSGDLPSFPPTLQYLFLGWPGNPGNHFTGSLILNQPIQLYINDNWITDVVIQDSSVLGTGGYSCHLDNNPLLGNPNIAGLTKCTQDGLYSAAMLPVTRSTLTAVAKTTQWVSTTTRSTISAVLLPVTRSTLTTLTKLTTGSTTTKSTNSMITTSVFGTTQLGSLEMTSTLETTNSATTMEMTTNFERSTAKQTLSMAMASGRMLSISMLVTGTNTATSSMGTVTFVQEMSGFEVNLEMMVRIIISAMILTTIINKSPFKREFKIMRSKKNTRAVETSSIRL